MPSTKTPRTLATPATMRRSYAAVFKQAKERLKKENRLRMLRDTYLRLRLTAKQHDEAMRKLVGTFEGLVSMLQTRFGAPSMPVQKLLAGLKVKTDEKAQIALAKRQAKQLVREAETLQ